MRVRFRKKSYEVRLKPTWRGRSVEDMERGYCRNPNLSKRDITILSTQSDPAKLYVSIHEALHALYWDLDEGYIGQDARDITRFLMELFDFIPKTGIWGPSK